MQKNTETTLVYWGTCWEILEVMYIYIHIYIYVCLLSSMLENQGEVALDNEMESGIVSS